jgi:hypothetical protein
MMRKDRCLADARRTPMHTPAVANLIECPWERASVEYLVFPEKRTGRRLADDCLRFQKFRERMVAPFTTVA